MMVLLQGWEPGATRLAAAHLGRVLFPPLLGRDGHDLACAVRVGRVIEQSANIVHEQGIQKLRDLLLVRKVEGTVKRNPAACVSSHPSGKGRVRVYAYQTPLRCMGPILTTWRSFSLFKMPSRRPRVMPATFSNFVPLIMWLSANVCEPMSAEKGSGSVEQD